MIDLLLMLLGLLGLVIASITDLKTREIPDWLSFSLIAIGISLRLMQSISSNEWHYIFYTLVAIAALFLFGNLMYYTKQWGGGDTKLLVAIAAVFTVNPSQKYFLISMLVNLIIVSTFYGLAWCIYFAVKQRHKFMKELPIYIRKNKNKLKLFTIIAVLILLPLLATTLYSLSMMLISISILLVLYPILTTFVEAVERSAMFREVHVSKLTEGDWITKDLRLKNKLIYSKSSPGLEKFQINLIKKAGIKYVPVKDGIPFVPAFLIAALLTMISGNLVIYLLKLF